MKKKGGNLMVLVTVVLSATAACAGDGTGLDENGNPVGGDTTIVTGPTLSADVQPIFTNNCAFSGCHGGTTPVLNQNLSAGQTFSNVVNVASMEAPALKRVRPGQPDSSYLIHKIQGTQASVGGSGGRMPLGRSALTDVQIQTVRRWVENGALNN